MAAAANHRGAANDMRDTFYLSNVCPQVGSGLNRDYWARLEAWTRALTRSHDHVWVVTGPLYVPQRASSDEYSFNHAALGPPLMWVAVPTHFFKVVFTQSDSDTTTVCVASFIVPNDKVDAATPLDTFEVPLEVVEACAGALFYREALQEAAVQRSSEADAQRAQNAARLLDVPVQAVMNVHARAGKRPDADKRDADSAMLQKNAAIVMHLCDTAEGACTLPPPNWFAAQGQVSKDDTDAASVERTAVQRLKDRQ